MSLDQDKSNGNGEESSDLEYTFKIGFDNGLYVTCKRKFESKMPPRFFWPKKLDDKVTIY